MFFLQLTVEEENAASGDEDCLDEDEDSLSISLPSDNGPGKGRPDRGAGLDDQGRTSALLKDRILKILSTDDEDDEKVCSLSNVFLRKIKLFLCSVWKTKECLWDILLFSHIHLEWPDNKLSVHLWYLLDNF